MAGDEFVAEGYRAYPPEDVRRMTTGVTDEGERDRSPRKVEGAPGGMVSNRVDDRVPGSSRQRSPASPQAAMRGR